MVKKRGTGSFLGGMYHIFRSKTLRNTFFKKNRKNVICTQNYTAFDSPYPPPQKKKKQSQRPSYDSGRNTKIEATFPRSFPSVPFCGG